MEIHFIKFDLSVFLLSFTVLFITGALIAQNKNGSTAPYGIMDLSGTWRVTWTDGGHGPREEEAYRRVDAAVDPGRYIDVPVPMELHEALRQKGLIDDPNFGINTLKARWISEQYWQYNTRFILPEAAADRTCYLVFKQLDLRAHIYVNGVAAGTHQNAHRPCCLDVTEHIKKGENHLIVAVESGLYMAADLPGKDYHQGLDVQLNKRHWLRKPQYQFIWDWNPRLINVGITGPVYLQWTDKVRVEQSVVYAEPAPDFSKAAVTVRSFIKATDDGLPLKIRVTVRETGQSVETKIKSKKGAARYDTILNIKDPLLWWPVGHGDQNLYTIKTTVTHAGRQIDETVKRIGIRSVGIDQSPHPEKGRHFIIRVNDRPIFLKGGNWVPPDMIYSSVNRQRLADLVDLALEANFNLLRIWGGGSWAGHDLLELCDENGLLVWHDFLFACAKYPADDPQFLAEVQQEITWAAREFAHHPSLAVWCGNNELEWAAWDWGYKGYGRTLPDYALFHHVIPVILKNEDPHRPYWPSSPYSPDHEKPNSPYSGDQHPWDVSIGRDGTNIWAYREYVDRFPNEGGVMGAGSPATLRQFLPDDQEYMRSFSWEHHDNTINLWRAELGTNYQMVKDWTGLDYQQMKMDDYVFASALMQAEGLTEYIANYRRRMFSSASAIFWMYNDSWPATHSWSIVDYYLRKKLAYHPVRRVFSPVAVVIAQENNKINIYAVNDTPAGWQGQLRYGLFSIKGGLPVDERTTVSVPANRSVVVASMPVQEWENLNSGRQGAYAVLTDRQDRPVHHHKLLLAPFKDLPLQTPKISITRKDTYIELVSPVFVWGACFDLDGESDMSDNCFDLFPDIPYRIKWPADKKTPRVVMTGNDLFK